MATPKLLTWFPYQKPEVPVVLFDLILNFIKTPKLFGIENTTKHSHLLAGGQKSRLEMWIFKTCCEVSRSLPVVSHTLQATRNDRVSSLSVSQKMTETICHHMSLELGVQSH